MMKMDAIVVRGRPAWCEPGVWASVAAGMTRGPGAGTRIRRAVSVAWSRAERKIYRKRKPIPVSQWSEKHRVLTMSALPGMWRNSVTPYLPGVMDTMGTACVREVVLCKTPQTGGSEATHNFIGYCIDRAPGPVLYVYPDEDTAKENSNDRVLPMIQSSPRLASFLTGVSKDATSHRIGLHHMPVYFAWARSASKLANKPIKYAVADEIDKEGFNIGRTEAHPLALIDKRFTTYRSSYKFIKISTPTLKSGNIWQALNACEAVFDYHVRCPACTHLHLMTFSQIRWEGRSEADPDEIKRRSLAWYECPECGARWDDETRNAAVRAGVWIERTSKTALAGHLDRCRPASVGFHIPAWISYFVSLSECAAAFLKGLKSQADMRDFMNGYCAEPWKEYKVLAKQEDEEILKCRADLPPQTVPASAVALTAGFDMQKVGFFYVVRAWARDYTSWLVDYGHLGTWEDLERMLFDTVWPVQDSDRTMRIWRAALDTGGTKFDKDISTTEEAYLWLQKNMGFSRTCRVWGTKGSSTALPTKLKMGNVLNKTPSGKPLKMGMRLVQLDTDKLKDMFHERMGKALASESAGAWLHRDVQLDYARQITAEEKRINEKGFETWEPISKGRDNHYLDAEVLAHALADWEWPGGGVNLLPDPIEKKPDAKTGGTLPRPLDERPRKRPGWFNRR